MKKLFWWLTIIFLFLSYTGELTAELRQDKKQVEEDFGYKIDNYKADGIITDGEYENRSVYRDLEIYWSNDNKYLYMALRGKTKGYISIGFQPGSMMKDADIIMGYVQDEKVEVFDQYSTGNFGPHPADEELGGSNDIISYGGEESNDYTIIEFVRLLKTEDKYDHELKSGKNKIIWAYSHQDNPKASHIIRGYGEIEITLDEEREMLNL